MSRRIGLALTIALGGAVLVLIALYSRRFSPETSLEWTAFLELLETLGIAIFSLAFVSILVESGSWQAYFEERLKRIVLDQDYFRTLDKGTLQSIQTNILKAQFKDQNLDREGSFLNHFYYRLLKYIGEPFREDARAEITFIRPVAGGWLIKNRLMYVCRAAGGSIQAEMKWRYDVDELEGIQIAVDLMMPENHKDAGKRISLPKPSFEPDGNNQTSTAIILLDDYREVDRLTIIVSTEYTARLDRYQYWQMTHPTKGFDLTIRPPSGHRVEIKPLLQDTDQAIITREEGYLRLIYGSWLLPENGVVWQVLPISENTNLP